MGAEVKKTIGTDAESIKLDYDAVNGRYTLETKKSGAGSHYNFAFGIGGTQNLLLDTSLNFAPLTDNQGSVGTASKRFALVRATTITPGDLILSDKKTGKELWLINEDEAFIYFRNFRTGKVVMAIDGDGNIRIPGRIKPL